jgi:hypothetical protein
MTRDPAEWMRQQRPNWLSATKLREYYADFLFPNDGEDPQHEIYKGVISGAIRVRSQGRIFTKEEAAALGRRRWSDDENDPYALPADVGLSLDDALELWKDRPGASAMREKKD